MPTTSISSLLDKYDGLLLDAYGVLLDERGAIHGAVELLSHLLLNDHPFLVVTNSASRTLEATVLWLTGLGLPVPEDRLLTSASLLPAHFAAHELAGSRCAVIGSQDARTLVASAGGRITEPPWTDGFDVLVVAGASGDLCVDALDETLTQLCRQVDAGQPAHMVLPNPDLVYPSGNGGMGLTAGSVALVLEAALRACHGDAAPCFVRLGKPHGPLFDEACRRLGTRDLVMIGDQLDTDIRGARDAGLDSALATYGVVRIPHVLRWGEVRPTYLLPSLDLAADTTSSEAK